MTPIIELRREAKAAGLNLADVNDACEFLAAAEAEKYEHEVALRKAIWDLYASCENDRAWWPWGLRCYKRAFAAGDMTYIPGFDWKAKAVAEEFPELLRDGDPAGTLFKFLKDRPWPPEDRATKKARLYRDAIELVKRNSPAIINPVSVVPF